MPITLVLFLLLLLLFQWTSWYHAVFPDSHESFHGCWSLVLDHELWHILFVTGEGRKRDSQGRVKKTEGKGGEWSYVKFEFAFFSTMFKMFKGFYNKNFIFLCSQLVQVWFKFGWWNVQHLKKQVLHIIAHSHRAKKKPVYTGHFRSKVVMFLFFSIASVDRKTSLTLTEFTYDVFHTWSYISILLKASPRARSTRLVISMWNYKNEWH